MPHPVSERADQPPTKEHHDGVGKGLDQDSDDAEQATDKNYLGRSILSAMKPAPNAATKIPTVVAAFNTCSSRTLILMVPSAVSWPNRSRSAG
jgi:hypothetical protein